jgi:hypothetical protein
MITFARGTPRVGSGSRQFAMQAKPHEKRLWATCLNTTRRRGEEDTHDSTPPTALSQQYLERSRPVNKYEISIGDGSVQRRKQRTARNSRCGGRRDNWNFERNDGTRQSDSMVEHYLRREGLDTESKHRLKSQQHRASFWFRKRVWLQPFRFSLEFLTSSERADRLASFEL